jgi:hypothetical protein
VKTATAVTMITVYFIWFLPEVYYPGSPLLGVGSLQGN